MKSIKIDDNYYEIIKNYKDGYNEEEFKKKCTDYFYAFDYIVGDWAYGKLRLKGFYDGSNKKCTDINDFSNLNKYLSENCAYGCSYFVAKRK